MDTLNGSVERVTFHNEETGFAILKVMVKGRHEPVTVKGSVASIQPGEGISASGAWINDSNYGRQFAAESITTVPPDSVEGIERYLGSGLIEGIGPVYAKRLVKKFGAEVFEVIDKTSARLEEVDGIGTKRRTEIKTSWEKQKMVREIMVFLHQYRVSPARAVRIYKAYGELAIIKMKENPYQLAADIWGIGFRTADEIAGRMGIPTDAPERLQAGLRHVLKEATGDGHCALPVETLVADTTKALAGREAIEADRVIASLTAMLTAGDLKAEDIDGTRLIFLPHLLKAETVSAAKLKQLASQPPSYPAMDEERALAWVETKTGKKLAPGQQDAIRAALKNRLLVITGGPGVGKTTILNSLLLILQAKGIQFTLAAPTGRAAKRLSESTGHEAKTLHRLLEYQPAAGFQRNHERPLSGTLFVLDETSMVDVILLWHFLEALPDNAHLVLVGDVDQLPSVGPGSVLADLINSGVLPVARLTEIFRQAETSRIITAAHAINSGRMPELNPPKGSDFYFIERETPEEIAQTLVHVVKDRLPRGFGVDPVKDVQVLTPMNRTLLGGASLNTALQAAINPAHEFKNEIERFGVTYRVGDKVIQMRNNYDKDVFNGDIGRITGIESEPVMVKVTYDDGREAIYESGELDELRLAYAITIHKSQGSEFPAVVIPVSTQHFVMLQRNLLYTGVTRGRKVVILVGDKKALGMAVRNIDARQRWSGLRSRLAGGSGQSAGN